MRRKLKTGWIMIPLLFLSLSGCVPLTREVVVAPKHETKPSSPLPVLPADQIDKKIDQLTRILEEKDLSDEDRLLASSLLSTYEMIRAQNQTTRFDDRKIIHALFTSLSKIDERYFSAGKSEKQDVSETITRFARQRKRILEDYLSGNYQDVIDECLQLKATFGPDSLTPEIGIFFAVSLAKKGLTKEAIGIGDRIIRELEGRPDIIFLRGKVIEWQLEEDKKEEALAGYEKLIDALDERQAILTGTRQMVAEKRPGMEIPSPAKIPSEAHLGEQKGPLESDFQKRLLEKVDELVQKQQFDEARLFLIRERLKTQGEGEIQAIEQALKTVEMAEQNFHQQQEMELAREKETLTLARKMVQEDKFEEAISTLEGFEGGQEALAPEMKELKETAIEKLINRERNKAAKIFLMARKTSDEGKKEELLRSSYEILKSLITKYPNSSLVPKLNNHLARVKKELGKLGVNPEQ